MTSAFRRDVHSAATGVRAALSEPDMLAFALGDSRVTQMIVLAPGSVAAHACWGGREVQHSHEDWAKLTLIHVDGRRCTEIRECPECHRRLEKEWRP
jgi:hypothetical protein